MVTWTNSIVFKLLNCTDKEIKLVKEKLLVYTRLDTCSTTYLTDIDIILEFPRHDTRRRKNGGTITIFIIVDYFHRLKSKIKFFE